MCIRLFVPVVALALAVGCWSTPEPPLSPPVPAPSAAAAANTLAYDGLYVGERTGLTATYVRFYADGHVTTIGSTGSPEQVAAWLGRTHKGSCQGTYTVDGPAVSFACGSAAGTVEHDGRLEDGALHLHWRSRINAAEGDGALRFVPVAFGAE